MTPLRILATICVSVSCAALPTGHAAQRAIAPPPVDGTQTAALPPQCPAATTRLRLRAGLAILGLVDGRNLICFLDHEPDRAVTIGPITGMVGDSFISGIDYRPQDGLLYGVGTGGGVYVIDPASAAATLVGRIAFPSPGFDLGMDFDPQTGLLRVVTELGENVTFDVASGATTFEDSLSYVTTGIAYSNNDTSPTTGALLYALVNEQIYLMAPPESGTRVLVGDLRIWEDVPEEVGRPLGLDIYSTVRDGAAASNHLFAIVQDDHFSGRDAFLAIDMENGKVARWAYLQPPEGYSVGDIAIPLGQR